MYSALQLRKLTPWLLHDLVNSMLRMHWIGNCMVLPLRFQLADFLGAGQGSQDFLHESWSETPCHGHLMMSWN